LGRGEFDLERLPRTQHRLCCHLLRDYDHMDNGFCTRMRDGPLNIALLWSRVSGVNTPEVSTLEARGPSPRFRVPHARQGSRTARLPDCRCTGDQLTPCGAEPVNLLVAAHRTTRSPCETPTTTLICSILLQSCGEWVRPDRGSRSGSSREREPAGRRSGSGACRGSSSACWRSPAEPAWPVCHEPRDGFAGGPASRPGPGGSDSRIRSLVNPRLPHGSAGHFPARSR
jgi:hypothetical protein